MYSIKLPLTFITELSKNSLYAVLGMVLPPSAAIEVMILGVIGKTKNDSFREQSLQGCQHFAQTVASDAVEVICRYDGPELFQDIREQAIVVNKMLDLAVDGLLISTTDSQYLVQQALKRARANKVPVIIFDSDLLPEHRKYRLAYVGTNNVDFGVALGEAAKQFKKLTTTSVCIQSGHISTPNLDERIRGVRFALSSGLQITKIEDLLGWKEHDPCPFYTLGKRGMAVSSSSLY